jgi:hypothetical protein
MTHTHTYIPKKFRVSHKYAPNTKDTTGAAIRKK